MKKSTITHNGTDGVQIEFTDISILSEDAIAAPSGGLTVDGEARAAINSILAALQAKRIIK